MRAGFGWAFGVFMLGCGNVADDPAPPTGAAGALAQSDDDAGGQSGGRSGAAGSDAAGSDAAGSSAAGSGGDPATECGASATNPVSCGTCGNACAMGVCEDGECVDVPGVSVVAHSAPARFVSDGQFLYWFESDPKALTEQLVRCSVDGCLGGPTDLENFGSGGGALTLADGIITFGQGTFGSTGATRQCLYTGCGPELTKLGDGTAEQNFQYFAANASYFAYATSQGAFVAKVQGTAIVAPTRSLSHVYDLAPIALSDDALLAVTRVGEQFIPVSCALTGCDDQPTALSFATQYPPLLAANGNDAFWLDQGTSLPVTLTFTPTEFSNGGIYSCATAGCSRPTRLVAIDDWYPGDAIAVDERDVYYTAGISGEPGFEKLMRCARAGCDNRPTELARISRSWHSPIVLDDQNVYWAEAATGSILKRKK